MLGIAIEGANCDERKVELCSCGRRCEVALRICGWAAARRALIEAVRNMVSDWERGLGRKLMEDSSR